ncbi:hypothetical protein JG687_00004308 [Phytophthora cactorum]|uniref:Uncharacterized protein n=1 Tax=Phytophthora cactorum TaxID=29920 RepID=A0A8T1UP37_9STRA|nr:hypothetical protein JG687_00004308 [Phytophthora cactorum]
MADPDWEGDNWSSYPDAAAYESSYTQQDAGYDSNEYWRVDADVYRIFLELAPDFQGESVEIGELPELCRQVGRPLRDEHEQFPLMQELDTTNSMIILRHNFVTWLLDEIHAEERAKAPRLIPNLEDEEAYFLAMAKAKLRKQHYNPTPEWTFVKIVQLVERNPLDEALIQRALYVTNEKLRAMNEAEEQHCNQDDNRKGYGAVVDTVTLNSDLMLVRTVHQVMFEFPNNPRLQLLGQAILTKLLPSAYVRAAYKAKIDPYFNL